MGEGKFLKITAVVTELFFEELKNGFYGFNDVEWDVSHLGISKGEEE